QEIEPFELSLPEYQPSISPKIHEVRALLQKAKRPLLFVGKGVHISGAYKEVEELSLQYNVPIITTPGGKGAVRTNLPGYLGPFGLGGTERASNYARSGVDLLVVIGTKLSDMSLAGFTEDMIPRQVIQFDVDPVFVGKSIPAPTLAIIGDAKANLQALLTGDAAPEVAAGNAVGHQQAKERGSASEGERNPLSAATAVRLMRNWLPADTVVFGDDGSHTFYAIEHFDILKEGTFISDDVFGTMGHAIGYAIGAKFAGKENPVACLTGDGCMMMHGTEISAAVCHGLPMTFVVLNNGRLDMVDKGMRYNVGRAVGTVYEAPANIAMFGESLGAVAFRCHTEQEVESALEFAAAHQGPTVVEIMVDPDEIPPTLKRG
ncbi:MAG TPA: thiamine pyrophosphate-dependent enzyme, partial [Bacillaceae bacterium]